MGKIAIDIKAGELKKNNDIIIGIDLGTTNSLVAYIKDGEAVTIKDADNKSALVPSVIYFDENSDFIVGTEAKQKLITHPHSTIYSVKRLMGKSYKDLQKIEEFLGYKIIDNDVDSLVKIRVKDKFYTPIELSAKILETLKERAESALKQSISKAVITVPAYFNDVQRQATRQAGKLAGLEVLRIVNEPTAASLAYGLDKNQDASQTIAVYDLGGGTFDVSILQIQDGIFEVLATNGDTFLGGDDIDHLIIDFWLEINGLTTEKLAKNKALSQQLRIIAEKAKRAMSEVSSFKEILNGSINCQIDREYFQKLMQPFIAKTINCCQQALKDASLSKEDIDHVVMVGGSTRVLFIKEQVAAFFGKAVDDKLNPDEVVALGAAIQADILAGNQKNMLLLDITPLSLGIETVGGLMDTIISRNTKVPIKAGRQYTTSVDGQKNLKISIYQGERDLVENNRKLGEFILNNIPPMPAGIPKIEIHFIIDTDGILKVSAKELRSGLEQTIEIRSQYGISEEDMAKMLLDSIQNAQSDMEIRALLEAKNEAMNIIIAAEKFVIQNAAILTNDETKKTVHLTEKLKKVVDIAGKDEIHKVMDDLNEYTQPLAHRIMDVAVEQALKGKKIT